MNLRNIPLMFYSICEKYTDRDRPAFIYKQNKTYVPLAYDELRDRVECFALGLMELGVHKGDRIGIASENRIEWIISSLAINLLGAIDVPIFPILTARQEEYIFSDSGVTAIIVSNNFQLNKVMQFKENIQSLRHIIVLNSEHNSDHVFVKTFDDVTDRGRSLREPAQRHNMLYDQAEKIDSDDLLTIIYTSGTTGNPKGVMLTHKNLVSDTVGGLNSMKNLDEETALSYLPFCHSFERLAGIYALFAGGATIALAESVDTVPLNIREIMPTMMTTVPRMLEMMRKKILSAAEKEAPAKKKLIRWALNTGIKYVKANEEGKAGIPLKSQYKIADKLVFSKMREKMGGNLRKFVTGGAAISRDICEFYMAIGINVLQGYGLTEASPCISLCQEDDNELGTVGRPFFNLEIKIAPDGEILVKGPNVMKGYWNDPESTAQAIDEEGWLYTGDVGLITEKGNLKITDRKKYIFVSSGGKNIAPQPIENLLTQSRYITQCVLIGENREYCTALLTPDFAQLKQLADEFGIKYTKEDDLITNDKIIRHIQKDIDYLQKDLAKFERVRRFNLLPKPFSVEEGELSPKLSVKRHVVEKKYAHFIEQMYGETGES